jgi:hypothetical protein
MNLLLFLIFVSFKTMAYVPTVESLFRHGSNPDISTNAIVISLSVKRVHAGGGEEGRSNREASLFQDKAQDYYKLFLNRSGENLKVSQARYNNANFSDNSLVHKTYYPNFTPFTIKPSVESAERGLFFGLIQSLVLNQGAPLVSYLKSIGVPVRLNNEIINRQKVELLARYKRYLLLVAKDKNARKSELNPLKPSDVSAKDRVEAILSQPMYVNTNQVSLSREGGQVAWSVGAGSFEASVSYKQREVQKVKYKSESGEFEIICKDYWLANGTHALPRLMLIKTFSGQLFEIEITNMRHFVEREDDLLKRLRNWDQILKGKESAEARPEFLL